MELKPGMKVKLKDLETCKEIDEEELNIYGNKTGIQLPMNKFFGEVVTVEKEAESHRKPHFFIKEDNETYVYSKSWIETAYLLSEDLFEL